MKESEEQEMLVFMVTTMFAFQLFCNTSWECTLLDQRILKQMGLYHQHFIGASAAVLVSLTAHNYKQ